MVPAEQPDKGAQIHHSVGVWPALLSDTTKVENLIRDERIVLTARAWPLGEARVEIRVEANGPDRCTVTMSEAPVAGPGRLLPRPASQLLIKPRNVESLKRLAMLAEGRHAQDVSGH